MKTININQLQAQISRVMKEVEGGEEYEVMRYSRPIAIIRPKAAAEAKEAANIRELGGKLDQIIGLLDKQ